MSIGSGSKEANDRNAEQKMTFVDDTKEFRDCSMRNESGGIEVSASL